MPICPHCGATVPEGATYCGNCGAPINSQTTSVSTSQPQVTSQASSWPTSSSSGGNMQARLEKATRRTEQLSYAVAGLGVAILVALIVLSFL